VAKLRPRLVLLIAVGLLGAAPSHTNSQITVFAAASLTDAFRAVELTLRQENPGFEIRFNFAGSQQLVAQMEQGARADVFASADERWMNYARDHSLVEGEPVIFVHNRLVVIIPRTNPARIARLQDMMKKGVKLVLAAQAVPAGKYSRDMLQNLSRSDGFSTDYATRVLANVVSNEETVKGVVAKVQLGEADAGMVYRSDVTPDVSRFVTVLEIPDAHNVIASYPIAVVRCSASLEAARAFINFVLSPEGQGILRKNGFLPIASGL
jgi:molybdate transport system substrate-binding protein